MVLVTGGTGLVGSYVLLQLTRKKKQVKALVLGNASKEEEKAEVYRLFKIYEPEEYQQLYDSIQWVEGNLLDVSSLEQAFTGVSQVYHIAGMTTFDERESSLQYKVNVEGTKNMLNLSFERKIEKFCFMSSVATLDLLPKQSFITEESKWNPKAIHSSYDSTKHEAETEVWKASEKGLKVIVAHPGVVLGSSNWEKNGGLLYKLSLREKAFYTSGMAAYIDAEDVAEICIRLMEDSSIVNERFILINENMPFEKIVQFLRKFYDKPLAKKIPDIWLGKLSFLSRIFARIANKQVVSKAEMNTLILKDKYSNEKIKKTLKYTFIPIEETLKFHASNYLQYEQGKNN
ncbi:MAG: NAD-dependent epimerase/dehydratase family protein [Flavobacteriaceae bacterium]|jgi:nucleoside-diphosphate-sugar epimerase|nr:NAD-dependent epimerase/dehydratase family protein [Flavobacteriaceae bacterium]